MGWSNDSETTITLPTGATTGARVVIDGVTGAIEVYDASNNLAAVLSGNPGVDGQGNSWGTGLTMTEGAILAPNSPINGATVASAGDITYLGGESLEAALTQTPQGMIANATIGPGNLPWPPTAQVGASGLLLLSVPMLGGRQYKICMGPVRVDIGSTGVDYLSTIWYTTDGSTPTTASPALIYAESYFSSATENTMPGGYILYSPHTNMTMNLLWGLNAGGTATYIITNMAQGGPMIWVEDLGLYVPDTGTIVNTGKTPSPPPKVTYTKTYYATAYKSYSQNGASDFLSPYDDYLMVGYYPSSGNAIGCFEFDTSQIKSDTSGATINYAYLYLNCDHTYYSSGMTFSLGHSSQALGGSTFSASGITLYSMHPNVTAGQRIKLSDTSFVSEIQANQATFCLYYPTNSYQYYGYYTATVGSSSGPTLVVNYTK